MPGERIGSERELAKRLDVSRARLREALQILRAEGSVRALIGRAGGIYAADRRIERNLNAAPSLPDIMRVQGFRGETRVLEAARYGASPQDRRALDLPRDADVFRIRRLRLADAVPLSLEENRLPVVRFPGLLEHDLTHLGRVASTVFGFSSGRTDETLEVVHASCGHAELLALEQGSPLVRIRRLSFSNDGIPTELGFEYFAAYRMRFHLRRFGIVGNAHRPHSD